MREVGWLGALMNTDALYTADLDPALLLGGLCCVQAPGAVSVHVAAGVCVCLCWKFKACARVDSQQLQTLGRSHSFSPRMKCKNA